MLEYRGLVNHGQWEKPGIVPWKLNGRGKIVKSNDLEIERFHNSPTSRDIPRMDLNQRIIVWLFRL